MSILISRQIQEDYSKKIDQEVSYRVISFEGIRP